MRKPMVLIEIRGGNIVNIESTIDLEIYVVDHDTLSSDQGKVVDALTAFDPNHIWSAPYVMESIVTAVNPYLKQEQDGNV